MLDGNLQLEKNGRPKIRPVNVFKHPVQSINGVVDLLPETQSIEFNSNLFTDRELDLEGVVGRICQRVQSNPLSQSQDLCELSDSDDSRDLQSTESKNTQSCLAKIQAQAIKIDSLKAELAKNLRQVQVMTNEIKITAGTNQQLKLLLKQVNIRCQEILLQSQYNESILKEEIIELQQELSQEKQPNQPVDLIHEPSAQVRQNLQELLNFMCKHEGKSVGQDMEPLQLISIVQDMCFNNYQKIKQQNHKIIELQEVTYESERIQFDYNELQQRNEDLMHQFQVLKNQIAQNTMENTLLKQNNKQMDLIQSQLSKLDMLHQITSEIQDMKSLIKSRPVIREIPIQKVIKTHMHSLSSSIDQKEIDLKSVTESKKSLFTQDDVNRQHTASPYKKVFSATDRVMFDETLRKLAVSPVKSSNNIFYSKQTSPYTIDGSIRKKGEPISGLLQERIESSLHNSQKIIKQIEQKYSFEVQSQGKLK